MVELDLAILNVRGQPKTYWGFNGTRVNIDVTVSSRGLFLTGDGRRQIAPNSSLRFRTTLVDWTPPIPPFDRHLANLESVNPIESSAVLEHEVRVLTARLSGTCMGSIPVAKPGNWTVRWWTRELAQQRRALHRTYREATRSNLPKAWAACRRLL